MPEDRAKVLAFHLEKAGRCPECGTRYDDWKEDHNAYEVETIRCMGCERIEYERESWADSPGSTKGLQFHLVAPNTKPPVRLSDGTPPTSG